MTLGEYDVCYMPVEVRSLVHTQEILQMQPPQVQV